ncbi:MAG: cupin domain-containing protein [Crocinitomicaceae bacterium]
MIQTTIKPDVTIYQKGAAFKVLQVTGNANMGMPKHISTKEAVISVMEGSAVIEMDGKEHLLNAHDCLIIPAKQEHSLLIMTKFRALITMPIESNIEFTK